jgi:ParB family chromosome partitioning protein
MSLRADIEHAGGNVQPILVRPLEGQNGSYEIVFGHRRHQACKELGLPVLSAIWTEPLTDSELFAAMDRENRERADLSPYEQGLMYHKALEESLYPSQRRLAESLGVSHTWVRKALVVAELPQPIIECFRNPLEIQHRHAEQIAGALEANRKGVLKRAEKIRGQNLSASEVVTQLADLVPSQDHHAQSEIRLGAKLVGYWTRDKSGAFIIKLAGDTVPAERVQLVIDAVTRSLS